MPILKDIFQTLKSRQIISSRGKPTVEIELTTTLGTFLSSCPSGASTGSKEAKVIVDNDPKLFFGKSVNKAMLQIIELILPKIKELDDTDVTDQMKIDQFLIKTDGTQDKSKLGANITLPISTVMCRLGAKASNTTLVQHISKLCMAKVNMPFPYFNVINGGVHAGNNMVFQEVMVTFQNDTFVDNYRYGVEFYYVLKKIVGEKYGKIATSVGDEGGFAPQIDNLEDALELIMDTHKQTNFPNFRIAIDCAASEFYRDNMYILDIKSGGNKKMSTTELCEFYVNLISKYPDIHSIEDPFAEEDYDGWKQLCSKIGNDINIVGDDLTVTNAKYIKKAVDEKLCNTLLVKLNQVGTVTETIEAVRYARENGMKIMVSHRSGETEDTFISDFAVGIGADYIKSGATCRGERVAKYNQLLRIAESVKKGSVTK